MKRGYSLMLIVFLVLTPTLAMVAVPGTESAIPVVEEAPVLQDIPEGDVELATMFFTETASSDAGLYYVCRRGTDAVAYFGASMVKYLSGGTVFTLEFPGSTSVLPTGENPTGSKTNYIYGNDPTEWKTGVIDYSLLQYSNIYPGIDLVYKIQDGNLKYEFIVSPFANPEFIQLEYVDADSIKADGKNLAITKDGTQIIDAELMAFQSSNEVNEVDCQYSVFDNRRLEFHLGAYDSAKNVIIDPVILGYSTYLGGPAEDSGASIAVEDGYTYVTGYAGSSAFPTVNPYQDTKGGGYDCFVTKFSSDGRSLIYSTFLGGSEADYGQAIAVEDGYVYITGKTVSLDFPVFYANDSTYNGGWDAFITKVAQDGQSLIYSTYLGGTYIDIGEDIAVEDGYVHATGYTSSTDFPLFNANDTILNGAYDCFVIKYTSDGQSIEFSTYLGGNSDEHGYSIDVEEGYAYVTGDTSSTNFPTANPYNATFGGGVDCFVTKFASDGQSLVFSTYLGGTGFDFGYGIDVEEGCAYVTGSTSSGNFPTVNAFDSVYNGLPDVFVTKFASDGQSLVYSTFIGDNETDRAHDIAVENGFAYVIGETGSPLFPMVKTYSSPYGEYTDCFVTQLALDGSYFIYSTAIGGFGYDEGYGIAAEDGHAYITGFSSSGRGFPMINAFDASYNGGGGDCFVAMLVDDSDGDALSDSQELFYGTNPYSVDTDNDNFLDKYEIVYGSNATDPTDYPAIPQEWYDAIYEDLDGNATLLHQVTVWLEGNWTEIASILTDIDEFRTVLDGLGISVGDSDYDGLDDLDELTYGTDPLCIDTDNDNLLDNFEIEIGTDPLVSDSDLDSYLDGVEVMYGTDPLDPLDYPGAPASTTSTTTTTTITTTTTTETIEGINPMLLVIVTSGVGVVVIIIVLVALRKRKSS